MREFTPKMKDVLRRALKTYGVQRQVCVSAEELCELSAALMKYARYNTHEEALAGMRNKITDEVADVLVMLNQLYTIFDLNDEEVNIRAMEKLARLEGWLNKSDSLQQSTIDRAVPDFLAKRCENCNWNGAELVCSQCVDKDMYDYRQY